MKFNYTKIHNGISAKAAIDLGIVWQHILVPKEKEDGTDVLVLFTTLDAVESYKQYQEVNKKGEPVGWSWKKVTESPVIQVTVPEEIQNYLDWFNTQESI